MDKAGTKNGEEEPIKSSHISKSKQYCEPMVIYTNPKVFVRWNMPNSKVHTVPTKTPVCKTPDISNFATNGINLFFVFKIFFFGV